MADKVDIKLNSAWLELTLAGAYLSFIVVKLHSVKVEILPENLLFLSSLGGLDQDSRVGG